MPHSVLSNLFSWNKLRIRSQLILILALLLSFIEVLTLGFTFWSDIKERRALAVEQVGTLSRALNQDLLKALLNPQAATYADLAFRLAGFESVSAFYLLNHQDDVVYQYLRPGVTEDAVRSEEIDSKPRFTRDLLLLRQSLTEEKYQYGAMAYVIDLSRYKTQLRQKIFTLVLFFPVLLIIGLLVAWWTSRYFTEPFTRLAAAIVNSDVKNNRFQQVTTQFRNEIGVLYNGYNEMIHEIEHVSRELRQAIEKKELADLANRAKSGFLANMSHELRTPLHAIMGYSEIIKEDARESGKTEMVGDADNIHTSGKYLLTLINDLLDLSKVEAGKMDLHMVPVPIHDFLSDLLATVNPLLVKKGNQIDVSVRDNITDITTDEIKIRQILINLISNANKFTDGGQIVINVWLDHHNGESYCYFQVKDSGIGMTPEQLSRLFKPFSQVTAGNTGNYEGTGLGLVISKRYCELLGGDITVESVPGSGSAFTAYILADPTTHGRA